MRAYRSSGLGRSLTLLRTFLVASAAILAVGAVALSSTLSNDLREAALADSARDVAAYTDAVLAPSIVARELGRRHAACAATSRHTVRLPNDVRGLNVYARDGRLVFSTTQPGSRRAASDEPDLKTVIRTDAPSAELVDPHGQGSRLSSRCGRRSATRGGRVVGAAEVVARRRRRHRDDRGARSGRSGSPWGSSSASSGSSSRSSCAARPRGSARRTRTSRRARTISSSRRASSRRRCSRRSRRSTQQSRRATRTPRATRSASAASRSPSAASCVFRRSSSARSRRPRSSTTSARSGCPTRSSRSPTELDRAEAAIMREHVTRGAEIVARISSLRTASRRSGTTTSAGTGSAIRTA